jgi:hypothetical protein
MMSYYILLLTLFLLVMLSVSFKEDIIASLKALYLKQALQYHPDKSEYDKLTSTILFAEMANMFEGIKKTIESYDDSNCTVVNECLNLIDGYDAFVDELLDKYNTKVSEYTVLKHDYNQLVDKNNKIIHKLEKQINMLISGCNRRRD